MAKSTKALINKAVQKIYRRARVIKVDKNSNLPVFDLGYSQARMLSAHRNAFHLSYMALHSLNILYGRPVSWPEIADLLRSAPSCGGYALFVKRSTIKRCLFDNRYGLWRKLDRTQKHGVGRPRSLFVATGLTITGQRRAGYNRSSKSKLPAILVW